MEPVLPHLRHDPECLSPGQMRRYAALSIYYSPHLEAKERHEREAYETEMLRRKTVAEGVSASQDRLGWARSRLRGLWKVDCEGYMSSLAHNLKKVVRQLGNLAGPPVCRSVLGVAHKVLEASVSK